MIQYTTNDAMEANAASGGTLGVMYVNSSDGKLYFIRPDGVLTVASANTETGVITFAVPA